MDSKLSIVTGYKNDRSYLKDVFVSPPFRVVPVGQVKSDNAAYLMLVSSSPGILDGDRYDLKITVEQHARLQLQSQSYQRLFYMDGEASQQMNLILEPNSDFTFVAHPIVPHEKSNFKTRTHVTLAEGCGFLLSEIITCGRKHNGELFRYTHFQNLIEVYSGKRLILKDNILLQPDRMPVASIGRLEQFTHQGTLIYLNTKNREVGELIEYIQAMLEPEEDFEFGISETQHPGYVVRCLGNGAEQLFNCFLKIQRYIWEEWDHPKLTANDL